MNCAGNCSCKQVRPQVEIYGCVNTSNIGNISMLGACSYKNTQGFYKKLATTDKYKISQAYIGDISPMFGGDRFAREMGLHTQ